MISPPRILTILSVVLLASCTSKPPSAQWSFAAGGKILSHPVADDGMVVFGSNDSSFYALDAASGDLLWKFGTRSAIRGAALVHDDITYVVSGNDLYALSRTTGKEIWSFINANTSGTVSIAAKVDRWIPFLASNPLTEPSPKPA